MKYRCNGCGAKIQTDNPKSPGYIRKDVLENNPNDFSFNVNATLYNGSGITSKQRFEFSTQFKL